MRSATAQRLGHALVDAEHVLAAFGVDRRDDRARGRRRAAPGLLAVEHGLHGTLHLVPRGGDFRDFVLDRLGHRLDAGIRIALRERFDVEIEIFDARREREEIRCQAASRGFTDVDDFADVAGDGACELHPGLVARIGALDRIEAAHRDGDQDHRKDERRKLAPCPPDSSLFGHASP
jgi:hypothetical protein